MKIVSKKTGLVQFVSKEEWEQMKARYIHRNFNIVDMDDDGLTPEAITVENIDMFNDDLADVPFSPNDLSKTEVEPEDEDEAIAWLKEKLDERGIKYTWNAGLDNLREKYYG